MTLVVVANRSDIDCGIVGEVFQDVFSRFSYLIREDYNSWKGFESADLFLHLGSSWSVYWDSVGGEVSAETSLMRHAAERGVPILGVCFGAQALSYAFGGEVERGKKTEIGWHDVVASEANSVFAGRWMQWHYDSFGAPSGFDVLAINDAGVQAIRRGRSLGVQFHPEANEAVVTKWMEGDGVAELAALGISPSALLEETRREVSRTTVATRELIEWFLENVAQGPTAHRSGN